MKPRPGAVMVREGFQNPRGGDGREEGTPEGKVRGWELALATWDSLSPRSRLRGQQFPGADSFPREAFS